MVAAMGAFIRWIAIAASALVLLGFAGFAVDQMRHGSRAQQNALGQDLSDLERPAYLDNPNPSPQQERLREREHGSVREAIDDANDVLLTPFADVVDSKNAWVDHGVPSLLALLVYGLGLGTLANMLPKPRQSGGDWRTA